ncbi:MAG: hypothetical protein AAF564_18375 [Bacteroidota bacterium]
MRLSGYLLLFFSLCPSARAQPASFHLESGVATGQPFYQCGYGTVGSITSKVALSFKIGATFPIKPSLQLNSGIRYTPFSCKATLVALYNDQIGIASGTQQTKQHLLAIPLHLKIALGRGYLLYGPDIVLLAHARQMNTWEEWTTFQSASSNRNRDFARLNVMFSLGAGLEFRLHTQTVYVQLLISRVAYSYNENKRAYVSGYQQELYLSMGIRL